MTEATKLCPICLGNSKPFTRKSSKDINICVQCRHLFWREMPTLNELNRFYSLEYSAPHNQEEVQENNRAYYRTHVQEIQSELGRGKFSMLDFGSSFPVLLQEAILAGASGVAVDSSKLVQEWGRNHGVPTIAENAVEELKSRSFDVLRFSHVLEHVLDPKEVLSGLLRLLKPGGIIYITQPNFPVLRSQELEIDLKDSVWPEHLHFFSPISLTRMLTDLDLEVFRFDTHPVYSDDERIRLESHLDLSASQNQMQLYEDIRTTSTPECTFPFYLGMNSACWAKRRETQSTFKSIFHGLKSTISHKVKFF